MLTSLKKWQFIASFALAASTLAASSLLSAAVTEVAIGNSATPAPVDAHSGKSIQHIMQEELAERQALEEAQAQGQLNVTLSGIRFKGISVLSDQELQPEVAKFLHNPMNYEQMLDIGMAVESYYRAHNHLARVILPPQDLSAGVLELDVIESVVSKIEVEEQLSQLPNTEDHILALLKNQQAMAAPLKTQSLERDSALINDVPGVSFQASLKESQQAGDTELLLKMYQSRTRDIDVTFDNTGSRPTGAQRLVQRIDGIDADIEGNSGKFTAVLSINNDSRHTDKVSLESPAHLRRPPSAGPHQSEWAQTPTRGRHSRGSWWA